MKNFILLLILSIAWLQPAVAAPPEKGKAIFTTRCAACHSVNKTLTGPALAKVDERRSFEWIVGFVQSSQTMIRTGNKEALAVYEQFNKIPMPDHRDLTDADIKDIVEYIKSTTVAAETDMAPFKKPGKIRPAYLPLSIHSDLLFFVIFFGTIVLLIAALLIMVNVKDMERNFLGEENSRL